MLSYRVTFVALATLFTVGMTSIASACCGVWGGGYAAPVAYAVVAPAAYGGCGACGAPTAAAVYAAPVAPAPIAVNTVLPTPFGGPCCGYSGCGDCLGYGCANCGAAGWGGGCGNCGAVAYNGCGNCGGAAYGGYGGYGGCGNCGAVSYGGCGGCGGGYAGASLYVVNQGPVYSGPAVMQPYSTYSPEMAYAPATDYPYAPGGAGYGAPGYGYGAAAYPNYYARPYYHRPYYARPFYRPVYRAARYAYHGGAYPRPYYRPGPRYYRGGAPHWRQYP